MEDQLKTPQDPQVQLLQGAKEDTACYFDKLSNEVVGKVMSCMTLKDRAHFISAYPRVKKFGQSAYFKTRLITNSDIDLNEDDLEKVLDPKGTAIIVSMDYPEIVFKPFPTYKVLNLMPKLQEVVLKDFNLLPAMCTCSIAEEREWTIFHCATWRPLLDSVKSLKFDNCSPENLSDHYNREYHLWLGVMYGRIFQRNFLRKVTFLNTLTPENLDKLVEHLVVGSCHGGTSIAMDVRDMRGNSFDMSHLLTLDWVNWSHCVQCLKKSVSNHEVSTFLKFEVSRDTTKNLCFRLTHDLDMEVLKGKIADVMRRKNQTQSGQ